MNYEGQIFRPPNEADSILLQVTVGCSHNGCRFCGMYRNKEFRIKRIDEIRRDLRCARAEFPDVGRVFLCDGDALVIPQRQLVEILEAIRSELPQVIRVTTYANAKSIARKSDSELEMLKALNLKLFHVGLESGDDETLRRMEKCGDAQYHVEQAQRAHAAGFKLFVTVLLGLGGRERSREHAEATARTLTAMKPEYVGALSLMLIPGTPLFSDCRDRRFELPEPKQMLQELRTMLEQTDIRGIFYANHASNYLPIRARFPRDRAEALAQVDAALAGEIALTPEWARGT
ncbi:MAG: radical SAM protein [Myxococcales bacterium]